MHDHIYIYIHINPYSQILVYIQYIQLAWPCFVYLWVLRSAPICSCVCVICLRQATALRGARLQTLHWDETPATGLRPEPWHTNTYTHTQMERPRLPRTKQSLEHRPCRVTFRCFSAVCGKQKGKKKKFIRSCEFPAECGFSVPTLPPPVLIAWY